ncbi:MAG: GTPase Era [Lysobacterales bacterium]|nr:MAG: GTPase Era [Xanthomonadales bacterium]
MSGEAPEATAYRCGQVAIIGRPNVGKSTLVNHLVGHKFSITSRKAQTTRHRLLGIKSVAGAQIIYVDTPGLHAGAGRALNRYMNRAASGALLGVDVIVFVVEAGRWTDGDNHVLDRLAGAEAPVVAALNKVDRISDKQELLPFIHELAKRAEFLDVVPISALQGTNTEVLEQVLIDALPARAAVYDEEQFTDRSQRFLAAEIVREKLTDRLDQELPYRLSVEIEAFQLEDRLLKIGAVIWVERSSQKGIVIGKQGSVLKAVGSDARKDMEALFERKVFLELWVKVKEGWSSDEQALQRLGYLD